MGELSPADPAFLELRDAAMACTACRLAETRTNVVFGVGDPQARLMLVGEAPGRNEDLQGEPFVGAAGQPVGGGPGAARVRLRTGP